MHECERARLCRECLLSLCVRWRTSVALVFTCWPPLFIFLTHWFSGLTVSGSPQDRLTAAAAGALCRCLSAGGSRPGCSQSPWGRRQWPPVSVCTLAPLWLKACLHLKPCRTVFCTRPICAGKFDKIYWEENCLFDLNTGCLLIQFKLVTPVFLAFDIFRHFMWFFNGYFCELWFFSTKYF